MSVIIHQPYTHLARFRVNVQTFETGLVRAEPSETFSWFGPNCPHPQPENVCERWRKGRDRVTIYSIMLNAKHLFFHDYVQLQHAKHFFFHTLAFFVKRWRDRKRIQAIKRKIIKKVFTEMKVIPDCLEECVLAYMFA